MAMISMSFCRKEEGGVAPLARVASGYLPLLAKFVAKGEKAGALQFVEILPHREGGVTLCALDGGHLALFHDKSGSCTRRVLLRLDQEMLKHCAGRWDDTSARFLEVDENGYASVRDAVGAPHFIVSNTVVEDGEFPLWRGVVTRALNALGAGTPSAQVPFPADLARFNLATKADDKVLTVFPSTQNGPVVVRHAAYPEFLGLFMPMLLAEDSHAYSAEPKWFAGAGVETETAPRAEAEAQTAASPQAEARGKRGGKGKAEGEEQPKAKAA